MVYREDALIGFDATDVQDLYTIPGVDVIPDMIPVQDAVVWASGLHKRAISLMMANVVRHDATNRGANVEYARKAEIQNTLARISTDIFDLCPDEHFAYMMENPEPTR